MDASNCCHSDKESFITHIYHNPSLNKIICIKQLYSTVTLYLLVEFNKTIVQFYQNSLGGLLKIGIFYQILYVIGSEW